MRKTLPLFAFILALGCGMASARQSTVVASFPASALKWIHIADPIFVSKHLQLDRYSISVSDEGELIVVSLTALDSKPGWMGSSGSVPDFVVDIRKKDSTIIKSYYAK